MVPAAPEPRLRLGELQRGRPEEAQVLRPPVRIGERGHHHERGPRMLLHQLRDDERARRSREPGHAQADLSLGESLRQLLKGLPLFEQIHSFTARARAGRRGYV
jgi:hypothetical protein